MKNTGFNILTEPWINVEMDDGSTKQVGAMDALKNAQYIKKLSITAPTQEYSVYRFLTAFLVDAIRVGNEPWAFSDMLEKGHFDAEVLDRYVSACEQEGVSFDLFDPVNPFMQCAANDTAGMEENSIRILDDSLSTGNNHAFFDHPTGRVYKVGPAEAFLTMLTRLTFTNINGVGYSIGIHGMLPFFTIVSGKNLFETLLVCLMAANNRDLIKAAACGFDGHPVLWRHREPIVSKGLVSEISWMEAFFFASRKIRLIQDEDGLVSRIYYGPGMKYTQPWRSDTFVNYGQKKDGSLVSLRPGRYDAIWKSIEYLTGNLSAAVISSARELFENAKALDVTLYGLETRKAAIVSEERYDLTIPVALLNNEEANSAIKNFISFTGSLTNGLKTAIKNLTVFGKEGTAFEAMGFANRLNAACEREFFALCAAAGKGITSEDVENYETAAMNVCAEIYRSTLAQAAIKASMMGEAEVKLGYVLRKARTQIKELREAESDIGENTNEEEDVH